MSDAKTVTLKKRTTEKSGNTSYAQEGVRASLYFNKNMFKAGVTPPDEIQVTAVGLAEPGDVVVSKTMTPEQLAKIQETAAKAEKAATNAKERADKAAAKAKAAAEKAGATAAPAEEAK